MRRDRPRYQVVLQLMPGAEPWMRVEACGGVTKLPAGCSLIELWEVLSRGLRGSPKASGQVYVRVPLDELLSSPSLGAVRKRRRHHED